MEFEMVKDYQKLLNRMHVVLDILVTAVSYVLAYVLQFVVLGRTLAPYSPVHYFIALAAVVPLYLVLFAVFQLYQPKRVMGRRLEASCIFPAIF